MTRTGVLQDKQGEGKQHAYGNGALQDARSFFQIVTSVCLCRQSACTHAQKSEYPVNHTEQHATHRNGTDIRCRA